MKHYISKDAVVEAIKKRLLPAIRDKHYDEWEEGQDSERIAILGILDNLEVKEVGDNSLEKFKSLKHINKDLDKTLEDWGYAPNLYYFDGSWHVDWISCEEGDSIKDFTGDTTEEAINKAYNWFHSTFCND